MNIFLKYQNINDLYFQDGFFIDKNGCYIH